ncbi:hypothetical protein SISNIDRAFT_464611 [Sistotremastrum niveocremeum HHB9708]|uniref:Uncharacterized protein n=1 Tax=Sistotremastrum niveocremeum HHB9708 TaxID=1314777 RepID=A0A164X457_9AGAM|nr:hypothetical protein SISNIDRAFT_464611 [Sistotremastrum niveocremeum HHB9708]
MTRRRAREGMREMGYRRGWMIIMKGVRDDDWSGPNLRTESPTFAAANRFNVQLKVAHEYILVTQVTRIQIGPKYYNSSPNRCSMGTRNSSGIKRWVQVSEETCPLDRFPIPVPVKFLADGVPVPVKPPKDRYLALVVAVQLNCGHNLEVLGELSYSSTPVTWSFCLLGPCPASDVNGLGGGRLKASIVDFNGSLPNIDASTLSTQTRSPIPRAKSILAVFTHFEYHGDHPGKRAVNYRYHASGRQARIIPTFLTIFSFVDPSYIGFKQQLSSHVAQRIRTSSECLLHLAGMCILLSIPINSGDDTSIKAEKELWTPHACKRVQL